jgi:hypothetical protein
MRAVPDVPDAPSATPLPRAVFLVVKAVGFLASLGVLGFALYGSNNELQLPLIQFANDPSLYPGDPFVATLSHYASLLWHVLWPLFRFVPEVPLLVLLTALQRLFCLFAAGRLARVLAGGSPVADAAAFCLFGLGMRPFLGWGTILPHNFEHTSLAVASFMLCLAFLLERKPVRSGIFLGLVGLANIMLALHAMALLAVAAVISPELRARWRRPRGILVAFVIMSPAIALAAHTWRQPRIDAETFLRLLWFYVPQHYFPSSWTAREWLIAALAGLATLLCLRATVLAGLARRVVIGLTIAHVLLLSVTALAEAIGHVGLLSLQLARSSDLWTAVSALCVLATLIVVMESRPGHLPTQFLGVLGLTAIFIIWIFRSLPVWFLVLAAPAWLATLTWSRSRRPALAAAAPLLLPFWVIGAFSVWLLLAPAPRHEPFQERSEAEVELTRWAQRKTPVTARFLVDPTWSAFRMLSRRSSFVTWKEGAGILWYQPFAHEWIRRLRALGVDPLDPRLAYPVSPGAASQAFARLDDRRALQLAHEFGLNFWIVPRHKPSGLPVAFQNAMGKVLWLGP